MEERIFYPGRILRETRIAKGLSIEYLAKIGGIGPKALELYESGRLYFEIRLTMPRDVLRRMAVKLGVPVSKFFEMGLDNIPSSLPIEVSSFMKETLEYLHGTTEQKD